MTIIENELLLELCFPIGLIPMFSIIFLVIGIFLRPYLDKEWRKLKDGD